jgi:hypothetical protein
MALHLFISIPLVRKPRLLKQNFAARARRSLKIFQF